MENLIGSWYCNQGAIGSATHMCIVQIAISASDPLFTELNCVSDVEALCPGTISGKDPGLCSFITVRLGIREWFRWYKTPDNKPTNAFGHGEQCLDANEVANSSPTGKMAGYVCVQNSD